MTTDTTVLQQETIGTTTSDWSQTVTFAPFNPSLGTLTGVEIGVTADVTGSVSVENLGSTAATENVSQLGSISVFDPDGAFITGGTSDATGSVALGAYDGTDNYAGTSGATLPNLSSTQSILSGTTADLALFTGSNPVPLTVDASVLFDETGAGNIQTLSHASAGAVITLQYDYIPIVSGGTSGSTDASSRLREAILPEFPVTYSVPSIVNYVTSSPQTFTIADATTGWTDDLSVAKFDPTLGALGSVNITVVGNEDASVGAANLGAAPAHVNAIETATLTLALPGPTASVAVSPSVFDLGMFLGRADGSDAFSGTAGELDQGMTTTATTSTQLTSVWDLTPFIGSGDISLPLSSISAASLDGPGNLLTELLDQAGATVTISYTYTPKTPGLQILGRPETSSDPTLTWTGDTNTNLANAGNWNPSASPTDEDLLDFSSGGGALTGTVAVQSLLFQGNESWNLTGSLAALEMADVASDTNDAVSVTVLGGGNLIPGG